MFVFIKTLKVPNKVLVPQKNIVQKNDKMLTAYLTTYRESALCRRHIRCQHIASRQIARQHIATYPLICNTITFMKYQYTTVTVQELVIILSFIGNLLKNNIPTFIKITKR